MSLRIRHMAVEAGFRGEMLQQHGHNVDDWDLDTYADAAFSWMRRAVLSGKDGEKEWAKIERSLWVRIDSPKRRKAQIKAMTDMLGGMGR